MTRLKRFIRCYSPYTRYQCVNLGIKRQNYEIVRYWDEYIREAQDSGYKLLAWNVWDKTMAGSIGNQEAFFPIRHEFIFVFGDKPFGLNKTVEKKPDSINNRRIYRTMHNKGADGKDVIKIKFQGDTSSPYKRLESVLSLCSETGPIREKHPATFPVALPAEYIKAMTDEGDAVIDPFGGSGSTLIACERLNRACLMMECNPYYCDVIIERWQQETGQTAVRLN